MKEDYVMKKTFYKIALAISLLLLLSTPALAQEEEPGISLKLNREFGYGGFGGEIQGTFSLKASGPDELVEVQFYIDEILIGTDDTSPYQIQFRTEVYTPGSHTFHAIGILPDGTEVYSNEITRTILSGEQAGQSTIKLVVIILAVVGGIAVIGVVLPNLFGKKGKQIQVGEYGLAGGAVCPRCKMPYSRHTLSLKLVVGKLERCPHCGKWAIVRRASKADLEAAEERFRQDNKEGELVVSQDEDENLRRALEDSRFDD